jgi:hypothetical protein
VFALLEGFRVAFEIVEDFSNDGLVHGIFISHNNNTVHDISADLDAFFGRDMLGRGWEGTPFFLTKRPLFRPQSPVFILLQRGFLSYIFA